MRHYLLLPVLAVAACGSVPSAPAQTTDLASLCDSYYASVAGLTTAQAAGVDKPTAMKVDAICHGSGSFGPKPNGNKMALVRDAGTKVAALSKS